MIAIGGSLGAMQALREIMPGLKSTLGAAIIVVLHTSADAPGLAPQLLQNLDGLPASFARDGEELVPNRVYVAPADWHLEVGRTNGSLRLRLDRGPKVNRHRPAVDPLFRSVARACGGAAIGVVLSGMLDDGTAGLFAIAAAGGRTLVQDPYSAVAPDMPKNALLETRVDYVLPPAELASKLVELAAQGVKNGVGSEIVDGIELSEFSCPECHGVLSAMGPPLRFRCRTGHTYGLASLSQEYSDGVERALWTALRSLREKASLARRIAEHASEGRREEYLEQAAETDRQGDLVRDMLEQVSKLATKPDDLPARRRRRSPRKRG